MNSKFISKIILATLLFSTPFFASASTIIDTDIVTDTIWTNEMSPIILTKKAEEKDKTFRIVNWAHLQIEAWVKVLLSEWMDFDVTSQCLKWHRWDCYLDTDWEKKLPLLTVNWTKENPVTFKWNTTSDNSWYWWNLILSSEWNSIENTIFQWWWKNPESYFVNISRNNTFENNKIKNIWNNAILMKTSDFKNNVIDWAEWEWIVCDYSTCNIENSVIANTNWIWLNLTPEKEVNVKNNLFYNNKSIWAKLTKYFEKPANFENNFFLQNWWWLSIYHNNSSIKIENNNFIKNQHYAIFSETTSDKNTPNIENNFYNIDLWPQDSDWEFFVTDEIKSENFSKLQLDFSFEENSLMQKFLDEIDFSQSWEQNFLEINSNKEIFLWDWKFQWSIFSYDFNFKNLQTKTLLNSEVEITIPSDQELFLCSIQTWKNSYDFKTLCDNNSWESSKYKNWKITFSIWNFTALSDKQIYFTVFKKSNWTTKNPTISFKDSTWTKSVSYELWTITQNTKYVENETVAPIISKTETEENEVVKTTTSDSSWTSIADKIAAARAAAVVENTSKVENTEEVKEVSQTNSNPWYIETWTISTKIFNWKIYFYLDTENWEQLKLLWSEKWWDLVEFKRSDDKYEPIRAYWTYYYSSDWTKKWIYLSHFHLK